LRRPTKQKRDSTGAFEKGLFLPAMVIAKEITMIGKEADQGILRVRV
jgi:hypothetical protein